MEFKRGRRIEFEFLPRHWILGLGVAKDEQFGYEAFVAVGPFSITFQQRPNG